MSPYKITSWNVAAKKEAKSVSVLGTSLGKAASAPPNASPEAQSLWLQEGKKKSQLRTGSDDDEEENSDDEMEQGETEDESEEETEETNTEEEGLENDDEEEDSSDTMEIEAEEKSEYKAQEKRYGEEEETSGKETHMTIPNSKGEFRVTEWSILVHSTTQAQLDKHIETLTERGCCGLRMRNSIRHYAFFPSEQLLKEFLVNPPDSIRFNSARCYAVWLIGMIDVFRDTAELKMKIVSLCPEARSSKIGLAQMNFVCLNSPHPLVPEALLSEGPLILKGQLFRVQSNEEFHRCHTLRIYGITLFKSFHLFIEDALKKQLQSVGITECVALNQQPDFVVLFKEKDIQLAYETLLKRDWSDEVLCVTRCDEPVYGLFLSNLPRETTEDEICALLECVTPFRVVCRSWYYFAVVYLSSEEDRMKCLKLQQSKINGQRVRMRIMDDHIYPLYSLEDNSFICPPLFLEDTHMDGTRGSFWGGFETEAPLFVEDRGGYGGSDDKGFTRSGSFHGDWERGDFRGSHGRSTDSSGGRGGFDASARGRSFDGRGSGDGRGAIGKLKSCGGGRVKGLKERGAP